MVIASLIIFTVSLIFFPVIPDLVDNVLTSSATTAKPFPLSPARAASIAALSASMFV